MPTSNVNMDSQNAFRKSSGTTSKGDNDWKLGPNVQVKIILKSLPIHDLNGSVRENSKSTPVAVASSSRSVKRKCISRKRSRSPVQTETETVTDSSGIEPGLLNSGDIIQELQKVILEFEPECSICCKFVFQLTQHIRDLHSPPPPSRRRSDRGHRHHNEQPSSSPLYPNARGSRSTAIEVSNDYNCDLCDQRFLTTTDLQTHLWTHTPPKVRLEIPETSIPERVPEAENESEVTSHRRKSRARKRINYAELIEGPQPTTTVFTDISGIPEHKVLESLTVENIKCEPDEIEFGDNGNEDPLSNLEGDLESENGDGEDVSAYDDDDDSDFEDPVENTVTKQQKTANNYYKPPYQCDKCQIFFSRIDTLKRHLLHKHPVETTNGDKPYNCDKCETYFSRIDGLRRHSLHKHQVELPYKCDICQTGFKKFRNYFKHKKTHKSAGQKSTQRRSRTRNRTRKDRESSDDEDEGRYKCEICGKCCGSAHHLSQHKEYIHTMKKLHQCEECGKCFRMEGYLVQHRRLHRTYGKKSHKCVTCQKYFGTKCVLIMHKRLHTGKRPYDCDYCEKSFISSAVRISHERSHKNCGRPTPHKEQEKTVKEITCEMCDTHFQTTLSLNCHKNRVHGIAYPNLARTQYKRKRRFRIRIRISTAKKIHKCEKCGKCFARKHMLKIHGRVHSGEKPFLCKCCNLPFYSKGERLKHIFDEKGRIDRERSKELQKTILVLNPECDFCGLTFPTSEDTFTHMMSTHEVNLTKPYMCNICKLGFPTSPELRQHLGQIHPTTSPYACKICKKRFVEESELTKHLQTTHSYNCDHCTRTYPLPHHLENHMIVHTKEKPHKCEICEKTFYVKVALIKHQDGHVPAKNFKCEECDHSFNSKEALISHSGIHMEKEEKNYCCGICGALFDALRRLAHHLRRTHGDIVPKSYDCKFCDEEFFSNKSLAAHVEQLHPGQKPFQCKICQKEFAKEYLMIAHSKIHKTERTVPCSHTGCTKFFRKEHMQRHAMLHTGDKSYKCKECGKSFAAWTTLSKHKMTHTGERPFMCQKCGKCFSRSHVLKLHMLTHVEEGGVKPKPYVCKECGKAFMLKGHLTTHSLIHSGQKSHMCEDCGMCFRLPHQLRAHLKTLTHAK